MPNLIHVECIKNMFDKESTFLSLFQAPREARGRKRPLASPSRVSLGAFGRWGVGIL